jgi:hypothetical protein
MPHVRREPKDEKDAKALARSRRNYERNKEKIKARQRESYHKNRLAMLERHHRYVARNLDKVRDGALASATRRRNALKDQIFEKYGCQCAQCGFSDKRALQIDHVNGGGSQDVLKFRSKWKYLRHVLEDDTGKFQILCANCNMIKRIVMGEHRGKSTYSRNLFRQGERPSASATG